MDPGPAAKRFISSSSSDPSFDLHRCEGEHHLALNACVNQGSDESDSLSRPGGDYRKVKLHRCPGEYKLAVEPPSREGIAAASFTRSVQPGEPGCARAKLRASRTRRHSEGDRNVMKPEGLAEVTRKVMTQSDVEQGDDVSVDVPTKPNTKKTSEIDDCKQICGEASEVMDEMKNLAVA
uniref:Uncharacterized protein n=1 Tax=Branchiostoma floridae TaxID=7739 RepID=C3Z8G8_BRAFL|eukprot:XP_002595062.1 hypothetical protein BRAFLDRAFT_125766 [Branchiostoma floridae]